MVVPWELCDAEGSRSKGKQVDCGGSVLFMWEFCLLCRDICLMSKTKFGSNTMLNILILNFNVLQIQYMLAMFMLIHIGRYECY